MAILDQQVVNITRTAIGALLETVKFIGLNPRLAILPNTTLNQKFNVQNGVMPGNNEMPTYNAIVIGNKGHYTVVAEDGSDESEIRPHMTNHNALYGHIPLVAREVGNDLTADQRKNYCFRTLETLNGKPHVLYMGWIVNKTGIVPQLLEIEIIDGIEVPRPYIPKLEDLNPKIPQISNNGTVVGSNKYIAASAINEIKWNKEVIGEIVSAHRIRTGSTRSPVISEIGMVTGVIKSVTGNTGAGQSFNYDEIIAGQIAVHIATNHPVAYNSNGLTMVFDIGASEPMLGDKALNVAQFAR